MTEQELRDEKASLHKQLDDFRDKSNQVLGAIMWINQALEKMRNAEARNAGAETDHQSGPGAVTERSPEAA